MNQLTVSQANHQIKGLLDTTFSDIYIKGEIGNLTVASSGHIYFSIKDDKSSLSCVMFRGNTNKLKFKLEVGLTIIIYGSVTVYVPRGAYQLICKSIEPDGIGGLNLALEQLKTKLQSMGYFDTKKKKQIPKFVDKMYLLTSNSGAVIEDMKKVAYHRWPLVKIVLIPTIVQGKQAKDTIVENIILADKLSTQDLSNDITSVIVLARGGGSLEDLWCFNEEDVAKAIYMCQTVTISAIGHETDWTICDMVCDKRASTPSSAMEIVLNDQNEYMLYFDDITNSLNYHLKSKLQTSQHSLNHIKELLSSFSIKEKIETNQQNIKVIIQTLNQTLYHTIFIKQNEIKNILESLTNINPRDKKFDDVIKLVKNEQTISIDKLKIYDDIVLQSNKLQVFSKVSKIKKI
ncbi:MAG: exodeoxyribonuclease VII large subunit [Epsilonproteobacteria bacterium]|nr:MAG: exodeoxyribonuclease VII large subunit [Campylobacteraceae bacterium 4484_166]RLA74183.1 MAG: exodeoxyribonuclease VII large subunit [Campylobacterota bacterium]